MHILRANYIAYSRMHPTMQARCTKQTVHDCRTGLAGGETTTEAEEWCCDMGHRDKGGCFGVAMGVAPGADYDTICRLYDVAMGCQSYQEAVKKCHEEYARGEK